MGMVFTIGMMEGSLVVIGKWIKCMGKELSCGEMVEDMLVNIIDYIGNTLIKK
jgi:hypothetical protein